VLALVKGADLTASEADVPHASPRQDFHRVGLLVGLRDGLVNGAHAARAEGIHERERPEDKALGLPLQQAFRLEFGQELVLDEVFRKRRRLGVGVLAEEFAHDLVELSALDEVTASQVPDEPFTGSQFSANHAAASFVLGDDSRAAGPASDG